MTFSWGLILPTQTQRILDFEFDLVIEVTLCFLLIWRGCICHFWGWLLTQKAFCKCLILKYNWYYVSKEVTNVWVSKLFKANIYQVFTLYLKIIIRAALHGRYLILWSSNTGLRMLYNVFNVNIAGNWCKFDSKLGLSNFKAWALIAYYPVSNHDKNMKVEIIIACNVIVD